MRPLGGPLLLLPHGDTPNNPFQTGGFLPLLLRAAIHSFLARWPACFLFPVAPWMWPLHGVCVSQAPVLSIEGPAGFLGSNV